MYMELVGFCWLMVYVFKIFGGLVLFSVVCFWVEFKILIKYEKYVWSKKISNYLIMLINDLKVILINCVII